VEEREDEKMIAVTFWYLFYGLLTQCLEQGTETILGIVKRKAYTEVGTRAYTIVGPMDWESLVKSHCSYSGGPNI
jgi:hypothetical protein